MFDKASNTLSGENENNTSFGIYELWLQKV